MEPLIDRAAVIERLATLPRYQALAVLLRTATPTVLMLRDILHFLERHGVSARTTGCALVLADPAAPRRKPESRTVAPSGGRDLRLDSADAA